LEALLGFVTFLLNRRLKAIQDLDIATLTRDLAEARRLTEQERLARTKLEEKLAPRHITEENRQRMIAVLRPLADAGRMVDFIKSPNDPEVDEFTHQLLSLLTDAGWRPAVHISRSDEPVVGISVTVNPQNPSSIKAGDALISALGIAGIGAIGPDFSMSRVDPSDSPAGTRFAGAAVRLTIGRK
jgi:hypothetical protein